MDGYSLFDVFLIIGLFHGVFIIIALQLLPSKNVKANNMLSLLLGVAIIMLFGRVSLYKIELVLIWRLALFVDVIIFLAGPLYYLYVRRLLIADPSVYHFSWYHFIPAMLHVLLFLSTLQYSMNEYTALYTEGKLFWQFLIVEIAGFISFSSYLVASKRLILCYKKREKEEKSFISYALRYLHFFTITLIGISFLWLCSILITYVFNEYLTYFNYNVMWLCIPLLMYLVGYFGLKNPSLFKISVTKIPNQRIKLDEIEILKKQLVFFMNQEKRFKEPDFTLKKLSNLMETSSNNVSWLLNNVFNQNFYDYINTLRIEEFIIQIEAGSYKKMTLLGIAYDVGFNSKSTFNKVFKEYKGITPSGYIKKNIAL